nr:hypothetical protein [Tanacetum cinerariifolium]
SIDETVTHWFTLIALSALRRFNNENTLSLMNLILRSILTELQVTPTKPGRMTKPYSSHRFIDNCFNAGNFKMEVKDGELRLCLVDDLKAFEITSNTVTHWFTLIALSALRRSDNENTLSLMNLILRSILTELQVTPTKPGRMTNPYSSHRFIDNCFNVGNFKMEVK